tara:strand:+ start:6823 stop:7272 length:450 start_codon:yes stop_codon:yes gene_type:complete
VIRKAENKDISGIINLVKEAHSKSISHTVKLDPKTLRTNIQICILSAEHFVVIAEVDGKIEGALIGVTHQLWYSRRKQASDLFFYVTENGKGAGANLMRRFISWAKNNPGVKEIMLGTTSGIGDTERTKKLYERMGVVRIGDTFVLPQE